MQTPTDLIRLTQLLEIERTWLQVRDPQELAHRIAAVVAALTGARCVHLQLDPTKHAAESARVEALPSGSAASFPLSIDGSLRGSIRIEHEQPSTSARDVEFLRLVATIAGLALERAGVLAPVIAEQRGPGTTTMAVVAPQPPTVAADPETPAPPALAPIATLALPDGSGGLAAIAAHDLRKPLSVAAAYTETIAAGGFGEISERVGAAVGVLRRRLAGLQATVDALLDVHADSEHALRAVAVEAEIGSLFEHLARDVFSAEAERIEWPGPESRFLFPVDPVLLARLLQNLIDNALEHSDGTLVRVDCTRDQRNIRVSVEAAGGSFPLDQRARISTSNGSATKNAASAQPLPSQYGSIGLRAVAVYARALRARIKVSSSEGESGSVVELSIPKTRLPVQGQPAQVSK